MAGRHPGRFSYVQYDNVGVEQQAKLKSQFEEIERTLNSFFPDGPANPAGRPKALALTALEESYMWTGKAVRDGQVARSKGAVEDKPERSNE